jgi:GNAT superfamily N-acetyltransferase
MTRPTVPDEANDPYQGLAAVLAQKHGLAWALDPDGTYLGGTDRGSDHHFLSYDRGDVVGILKFRWHHGELHLAHILVAPTHRNRGRAGQMLDRFLAWAGNQRELDGFSVTCEVTATDPDRVASMLLKRGFTRSNHGWRRQV